MTKRLAPYGSKESAHMVAKVGKSKTPNSLVARMPSAAIAAKVGGPPEASPFGKFRFVERLNKSTKPAG